MAQQTNFILVRIDTLGVDQAIQKSKQAKGFLSFTLADLKRFVKGQAGSKGAVKRPPGLVGRVFSKRDHHEVLVTLLQVPRNCCAPPCASLSFCLPAHLLLCADHQSFSSESSPCHVTKAVLAFAAQ